MVLSTKNILTFSFALVTLANCGGAKKPTSRAPANIQPLETGLLPPDQKAIATRICYAYQSKATAFRTSPFMGKNFNFNIRSNNCSNQVSEFSIAPVLRYDLSNSLEFFLPAIINVTPVLFANAVQTDTTGFLSQLCSKVKNNQPISNTNVINDVRVQVEFFRESLDSYTLRYFENVNGKPQLQSADTFKVRTQFNLSGNQILGMDEVFTREKICPGLSNQSALPNYSQFIQTFDSVNSL